MRRSKRFNSSIAAYSIPVSALDLCKNFAIGIIHKNWVKGFQCCNSTSNHHLKGSDFTSKYSYLMKTGRKMYIFSGKEVENIKLYTRSLAKMAYYLIFTCFQHLLENVKTIFSPNVFYL